MDGDEDTRAIPTAQPTTANIAGPAGSARHREDKRFSGFEDLDWRDNELHKLDFLDVDEEEEEAKAERAPQASNKLPEDMSSASNFSNVLPDALEADTCRICSGPAEPGMPLYHPCKCSGTIRHVHQDCLKSWLDTSHRTRCDLCNHTFAYKKLYSLGMPSTLPARVVIGPMLTQVGQWAVVFLRLLLVGTVWLALLPALLHWCWRVGFWLSDYVSLRLSGKLYYLELYGNRYLNATDITSNASASIMPSTTYSTPHFPDSNHQEVTFPTSLLQALSTAFPTHEPLSSAISSLQAVLQKRQTTGTEPAATPHPNSVMMASAFSQIASLLQDSKYNSRRSRFRPPPTVPGEPRFLQRVALYVTGRPMFEQGSSFNWDLLRLGYHLIYRTCGWILSSCFAMLTFPSQVLHTLSDATNTPHSHSHSNDTVSIWQIIDDIVENLTTPIVTGQIIAVAIVVAFVLLFFLREWVMVNAEPGMFDDGQPPEHPADNENGVAVAPQVPNLDAARNDVPGAFPPDANPPLAAPRPAEWDRDVDLAEPRPPSPNIISLEEQEELMKEVIAWRKEQDKVISKSKAKVDEWQWEKKRVIIDDWKEQKMKAIKDKVAIEDDGTDLFDRNLDSSTHAAASADKGKGKRRFYDSDTPWESFDFQDSDSGGNGGADVEHIEVSSRPTRKMPPPSRRGENSGGDPTATSSTQHTGASSTGAATPSATEPIKSLASFEFSFSTPRSLSHSAVSNNGAPTSFLPGALLTSSTVSLDTSSAPTPRSASLSGSVEEPVLVFEGDRVDCERAENRLADMLVLPVTLPSAFTRIDTPDDPLTSAAPLSSFQIPTPTTESMADNTVKQEQVPKPTSATNPALSVFGTLVPPTPPSSSPIKLPFSIRDLKVAPLEPIVVASGSTTALTPGPNGRSGRTDVTDVNAHSASTSNVAQPRLVHVNEPYLERGATRRQRHRGRPGPPRLSHNVDESAQHATTFPHPLALPTTQLAPQNWTRGIIPALPLDGPSMGDSLTPFISRPFVFPQTSMPGPVLKAHAGPYIPPSSQGIKKPAPILATTLNVNAKPFQPGTMSAPITPIDHSGISIVPRGYMGFPQGSPTFEPFARAPMSRLPDSAPFAYAPFEAGPATFLPYGQVGPLHPATFSPQPYSVPHSAPELDPFIVRPVFNVGARPAHGHHMSMGMSMGTGPGRPAQDPVPLPVLTRGRALTTGADITLPPIAPLQPSNGPGLQSAHRQAHQRSSSLSTRAPRSSHLKQDDNNLLRPSSSSSGDSSTPSATILPMPWYGLPDPRPEIDRKKLEELEKKEMQRREKAAAKSQGNATATDMEKQPASAVQAAPFELRIIESGKIKKDRNPAGNPQVSPSLKKELPTAASGSGPSNEKHLSKPSARPPQAPRTEVKKNVQSIPEPKRAPVGTMEGPAAKGNKPVPGPLGASSSVPPSACASPVESTHIKGVYEPTETGSTPMEKKLDIPAQGDSVTISLRLPHTLPEPANTSVLALKEPELLHPKLPVAASNLQFTHENRKQEPVSISIPSFEPNSVNHQATTSPLKRPPLPSAASPIVVEERPSSKVALYQAPEEVRPQVRQGNGKTAPENGFMEYYFQPLESDRPKLPEEMDELNARDGSESAAALPFHNHDAQMPAVEEELPDLVDFDVAPEDDAIVDGAEALADIANAEEGAAAAAAPAEDVWEDEWTHLLEAVGMTGPWYCIVQNAALVIVIFNVTLGVGVFMPYILGKTTSLIVVDPSNVIVHLATSGDRPGFLGRRFPPLWKPRQGASFSFVGKGVTLLFGDWAPSLKYVASTGQRIVRSYLATATRFLAMIRGLAAVEKVEDQGPNLVYQIWSFIRPTSIISGFMSIIIHSLRWYQTHMPCQVNAPAASSLVNVVRVIDHAICSFYPEVLKDTTPTKSVLNYWVFTSLQEIAADRMLAIIFGYLITTAALALHSRISVQRNSYMVLMLFKVGCFVAFEAVIKPLLFGFVIDVFTLSLFPGASVQSRIAFWKSAPYSNLFHHWLVGNVVVVQFLYFLQDIQKSLRPGALLQIRKALDPTTPSIRDMINKSLIWHAIKYTVTLTTNLCLLWVVLGLTIDVNNLLTSNFAPLRWNLRRPLSEVPVDLVILHIFLPATFRFLKLKRMIRNMAKTYFTELSRLLNLQSVLLGEALIDSVCGSYWRVPVAEDAIRLAGRPYAIQTDALGNGLTQEDKDMIDMQIFASRKGQRIPHNDYKVVFYPDHFLLRIALFLLALWAAFFGAAWTSITLPIRIGRLVFKIIFDTTNVHDMYSWIVGLYVFWFGSFAKYLVGREQRRWSKYLSTRTRTVFPVKLFLRHTATMLGRLALAVLWLIVLLPSLIGLLFEIYVVLPITYQVYPGQTPVLRLTDAWTTGMIISAIILRAARLGRPDQLPELFERVRREGWFKIKARALTSELGPPTLGLACLVFAPLTLQYILPAWLTETYAAGSAVLKVFLPSLFFGLVAGALVTTVHGMLYMWVEAIRDQKYLEKEIIQNMEDPAPTPA